MERGSEGSGWETEGIRRIRVRMQRESGGIQVGMQTGSVRCGRLWGGSSEGSWGPRENAGGVLTGFPRFPARGSQRPAHLPSPVRAPPAPAQWLT